MVELIVIGAAIGGLAVKVYDFIGETIKTAKGPRLTYSEREALEKKQKDEAELREWANRPVLSDDAFAKLKEKVQALIGIKGMNYNYPEALFKEVFNLDMRFSIKQIHDLMPLAAHWCVFQPENIKDETKAQREFRTLVKENLTSKVEAKEAVLNLLLDEKV